MGKVKLNNINPRYLQKKLLDSESRKIVIVAHRRFGKTTLALMKILKSARPKTRFFYIAPTYRQAKVIAWQMLCDMIPPEYIAKRNEVELIITLLNGCVIELKGADNPDTLRGVGLHGCVLDEYAQMNPSMWSEIIRPALTDKQGWAMFIGTPKGKNHFYDLFMNTPEEDRVMYKASETGIIPKEELEAAKSEMSTDEYEQEFECGWLYFSGQIYKEFNRERHIVRPFPIDSTWLRYCAIDYGQVNPTAVLWFAVDYDGRIFVYDEHYEAGKTVEYHAKVILDRRYNLRTLPLLDPSAFARNRSKGDVMYSVADEFAENGVVCTPAQNDVLGGINRVKEYFQRNDLQIFETCRNLIRELETYRWKDKKRVDSNAPEEPLKMHDHAVDALRYMILSRPYEPKYPKYRRELAVREKELQRVGGIKKQGDWYN